MMYIGLIFTHWVADFVCQNRYMAEMKSKNILALLLHVAVYSVVLFCGCYTFANSVETAVMFTLLNGLLHGLTDYFSSKFTSALWQNKNTWGFFTVIGLDQLIHNATLYLTMFIL